MIVSRLVSSSFSVMFIFVAVARRTPKARFSAVAAFSHHPTIFRRSIASKFPGAAPSFHKLETFHPNLRHGSGSTSKICLFASQPPSFQSAKVEISPPIESTPIGRYEEDASLDPRLKKSLRAQGVVTPTPIQAHAIPLLRQGYDVMGAAATGMPFSYLLLTIFIYFFTKTFSLTIPWQCVLQLLLVLLHWNQRRHRSRYRFYQQYANAAHYPQPQLI
mmetsp:Transcript_4449/g.5825  ORF Transcript_4449/g.5825 Transcript_4449/m.5825 type:complete len:218 (-) Transcript_4449:254-907(-)